MILREYNEERHIKNEKEISYQEGMEAGLERGLEQGKCEMLQKMVRRMYEQGKALEIIAEELGRDLVLVHDVIED